MSTGNKRVSQLVELTSAEIQPDDLFLVIDATAKESKKIRTSELEIYLQGTGSSVTNATSASYILGTNVDGPVTLANNAYSASTVISASYAPTSKSSSYALTASYAMNGGSGGGSGSNSSSYLIYVGTPNGTASYAIQSINSVNALTSNTTNFLTYFGGDNGTASYAIKTGTVDRATYANTASYFLSGPGASVNTASYALFAEIAASGFSNSSSYLVFSPDNGTASYAMSAKTFADVITDRGIFLANTQSNTEAYLDNVDILWSTLTVAKTPIEAVGTIKIPFTSSTITNGTIYLSVIDRNTGFETILDSTPISFNLSPSMGTYGNNDSGSVKQTFNLMGQSDLYGSYLISVSASNNIQIESTRKVRFNISSETDTFDSYANVPIKFDVTPSDSATFTFTSTDGGPFTDDTTGLLYTMSLGKQIYTLDAPNQTFSSVNYFWKMNSVTESNFSNNPFLTSISGVPNTLTYLSCSNCSISSFYTFKSSSLTVLNCSNNNLNKLSDFPDTMSYINCSNNTLSSLNLPLSLSYLNCSNNSLTSLSTMPDGLTDFFVDDNNLSSLSGIPNSVVSMSANNNSISSVSLPSSLEYLSINNNPLSILPTLPTNLLYLSSYSCSLFSFIIDNMTNNLVTNGMISGTIDVRGNGTLGVTATSNMTVLQSNGWTTLYDY